MTEQQPTEEAIDDMELICSYCAGPVTNHDEGCIVGPLEAEIERLNGVLEDLRGWCDVREENNSNVINELSQVFYAANAENAELRALNRLLIHPDNLHRIQHELDAVTAVLRDVVTEADRRTVAFDRARALLAALDQPTEGVAPE